MKVLNYTGLQNLWTNIKNYITAHTPTKTSELTNDSGFLTSTDISSKANDSEVLHKAQNETVTGEKTFKKDVKIIDLNANERPGVQFEVNGSFRTFEQAEDALPDNDGGGLSIGGSVWSGFVKNDYVKLQNSMSDYVINDITFASTNDSSVIEFNNYYKVKYNDDSGMQTDLRGMLRFELSPYANVEKGDQLWSDPNLYFYAKLDGESGNTILGHKSARWSKAYIDEINCYEIKFGGNSIRNILEHILSLSYVTHYSSTALTSNSTNSLSVIDNQDSVKVNDKVIDSTGKMFYITSVDHRNGEFEVGSVVDTFAKDSAVVHSSGNETVSGSKTFTWPIAITSYPCIRMYLSDDEWNVQPATAKQSEIRFTDKNAVLISYITFQHRTDANEPFRTCWRQQKMDGTSGYFSVNFNNLGEFYPENYNSIKLGKPNNRWLGVYAMNYYYGANDVEFSTKFVTTDTNQTISGAKTFSRTPFIYNSDTSGSTANLYFRNQLVTKGDTSTSGSQVIRFSDSSDKMLSRIQASKVSNGSTTLNLRADTVDTNNNDVTTEIQLISGREGSKSLSPQNDNAIDLGRTLAKWKNLYINQINGLTPSSLSLPDLSNSIDISSYITDLTGSPNIYSPPANGYIVLRSTTANVLGIVENTTGMGSYSRGSNQVLAVYLPVVKNSSISIYAICSSLTQAKFIPCQGNV